MRVTTARTMIFEGAAPEALLEVIHQELGPHAPDFNWILNYEGGTHLVAVDLSGAHITDAATPFGPVLVTLLDDEATPITSDVYSTW